MCVLTSKTPEDENSFEEPTKVVPQETTFEGVSNSFDYTFPPYSVTIMRLKAEVSLDNAPAARTNSRQSALIAAFARIAQPAGLAVKR